MKKRRRVRVLLVCASFLVFVLASSANATLIMTLSTYDDVNIDDIVLITVNSDAEEEITWGVYLDPTSDFTNGYAGLQNPTMLDAAGGQAEITAGAVPGPDSGHDYASQAPGATLPSTGDWSTVEFVGLVAGTYTIDLYQPAGGGQLATVDITVLIPEPATIALLGLGSCLLLIRRRK